MGGDKQHDYILKEDASSPTVAVESVLLSCIIDAEEERDVATINIPNAFIQTKVVDEKDQCAIRLRGTVVDFLLEIAPDAYQPCVKVGKNGVKQLIVQATGYLWSAPRALLVSFSASLPLYHMSHYSSLL